MADRKPLDAVLEQVEGAVSPDFEKLIEANVSDPAEALARPIETIVVGTLVGFIDNGATPLVTYRGQPGATALAARSTVDLHGSHIGRDAVLMFEAGDPQRPIVVGCIRQSGDTSVPDISQRVQVDADGERLVINAQRGLVLRCGKASITLSPDGKVVVKGAQVVSHATGLNRIKGGSVQLN